MKSIVVTGAAGFIASNLVRRLNADGYNNLILVDDFSCAEKRINLHHLKFEKKIERTLFIEWLTENAQEVEFIFHLGARTDTSEFNFRILDSLNLSYSKTVWEVCSVKKIPFLYASSAATYGLGENGFSDVHALIKNLKPLNPYGLSKHLFDLFALEQENTPPFWCGLKFFNVYGPFEWHKKRMASVILHAYQQIKDTGEVKLFKSHRTDFSDGGQQRDFIFVNDITDICLFFFERRNQTELNGIYNAGTGAAHSFSELATTIFSALNIPEVVEYIPTPEDIRDKYQYYTQADITKLRSCSYTKAFTSLKDGVKSYVDFLENSGNAIY